jgi:hypothetical protein
VATSRPGAATAAGPTATNGTTAPTSRSQPGSAGDASLAGLTICDVTVEGAFYPIQLSVDTKDAEATYAADKEASAGVALSGIGDKAFKSSTGIEVLSSNAEIEVIGPAGPVL